MKNLEDQVSQAETNAVSAATTISIVLPSSLLQNFDATEHHSDPVGEANLSRELLDTTAQNREVSPRANAH